MKATYLLFLCMLCISCHSNSNDVAVKKTSDSTIIQEGDKTPSTDTTVQKNTSPIAELPIKQLPLLDSTNFDNYKEQGIEAKDFSKNFDLESYFKDASNIRVNYQVQLIPQVYSVVVTMNKGDHELITALVNISSDNKIIDQKTLAYDEIAESAFRISSTIHKEKIISIETTDWGEGPLETELIYSILETGKFKLTSKKELTDSKDE